MPCYHALVPWHNNQLSTLPCLAMKNSSLCQTTAQHELWWHTLM
jgi:hypothetical protein